MSNSKTDTIDVCPVCEGAPTAERTKDFYPCDCGAYFKPEIPSGTIETHSGDWAERRKKVRDRFFESARNKLSYVDKNLSESDRLLEIGIGTGELLLESKRRGYDTVGIDANRDVYQYCRDNIPGVKVHHGYLREVSLEDESFDAIMMSHLFEHVPDPNGFLHEVGDLLNEGGIGYIGTPNVASYADTPIRSQFGGLNVADHKVLYTPNSLKRILEKNGFSEVQTWTTISGFDVAHALRSHLIEQLGIQTKEQRVTKDTDDDSSDSRSLTWDVLREINTLYTDLTHRLAPVCNVLFLPYHERLKQDRKAPMLHCTFRKPQSN